jgi:lipoprotein-releasing system ATP-binding protein
MANRTSDTDRPEKLDQVVLSARDLVKDYHVGGYDLRVLRGVSLDVHAGELLTIAGPSGAGKSTLLHLLGMLDTPTSGSVRHRGRDLATLSAAQQAYWRSRLFGFVFQFYHLLPDFTALENVAMPALVGAGVWGWRGQVRTARARAQQMLDLVHLGDRAGHRPAQLSGGERQRVAIARALINEPEVLFCDEPTGNLDSETGHAILDLLHEVQRTTDCTLMVVTHDDQIAAMGDRLVRLQDGRIAD